MKNLNIYTTGNKNTIKEAISKIQNSFSRCVVVLNDNKKVVGVFSEGDVLRAILNEVNLHAPLIKVLKPSFQYLTEDDDVNKAYALIKKYGITLVPVIDDDFNLKDVITIFDVLERLAFINGIKPE